VQVVFHVGVPQGSFMNDINNELVIVRISKTKWGKVVPQKKRASKIKYKKKYW
jgi:hypothetical protein